MTTIKLLFHTNDGVLPVEVDVDAPFGVRLTAAARKVRENPGDYLPPGVVPDDVAALWVNGRWWVPDGYI